jgi:hypothetical protein
MTQNGQQKNFGKKNLIQDLITTAEMTNHAPTTNLVLLFLPCPPISLNFTMTDAQLCISISIPVTPRLNDQRGALEKLVWSFCDF